MKRCGHTYCISPCRRSGEAALLHNNLLQTIINDLPRLDEQRPSLLVLIGNVEKSIAIRALFGLKNVRRPKAKEKSCEMHLHLDPSTALDDRPMLLANWDVRKSCDKWSGAKRNKCHEAGRHFPRQRPARAETADDVHAQLLSPFTDVFCFFSADLGSFRQIAQRLALWLEKGRSSTLPRGTLPSVVIVTSKFAPRAAAEEEAKKAFLWMLGEETPEDPFQQLSAIDVVALSPKGPSSAEARYRRVGERLMQRSGQVRKSREDGRVLFSATHFAAFLQCASARFAESPRTPFDFVKASRAYNPVAPDLQEHFSNFLEHTTSSRQLVDFAAPMLASSLLLDSYPPDAHMFDCRVVLATLYEAALHQVSEAHFTVSGEADNAIPRSSLINMVEKNLLCSFEQLTGGVSAVDIHSSNLARFRDQWKDIQSSNTCLCCLRRRPQYGLPCGHCICENCVVVFGDGSQDDPWVFHVRRCFLCDQEMPNDITVKVHPPTAGVGVLCIDGGGTRGIVPLILMKRIQDRIGLPIPLQRFVKVAFGVSIGAVIAIDHCINGRPLDESIQMFPGIMERAFRRRTSLKVPFLSRALRLLASYFADGLYSANNIESVLREVIGADKNILDCSYATSVGTKVGLPVATVSRHPLYRMFTNYNGVGKRNGDHDRSIIKPKDGAGRVLLREIARAVSAAPGFFPPKHIDGVGTFQDPGLLENDPELWARSEVSAIFPHLEEPDFVVSLGTGEPGPSSYDVSTEDRRSIRKHGMFRRGWDLTWEKARDKVVRRACSMVGPAGKSPHRYRLNVDFDGDEPRLDDTSSIPELISKVQTDASLSPKIDAVARCLVASLFYFELDSLPRACDNDKYMLTGQILCSIRHSDPALKALLVKLTSGGGRFLVNGVPIVDANTGGSFLGKDGNLRIHVSAKTSDRLAISLDLDNAGAHSISGSPFSVQKLVTAQGLDAPFGRPDHRKRKRSDDDGSLRTKRRRAST